MDNNTRPYSWIPRRKIRFDIVTLFLILVAASSLSIIFFAHYRNYKNILSLANSMAQQVNVGVVEKIAGVIQQAELIPQIVRGSLVSGEEITVENTKLVSNLINMLDLEPFVTSINIGTSKGNLLSVFNAPLARVTHFYGDLSKTLPNATRYAIRIIDRSSENHVEHWIYKGSDGNTLAEETIPDITYDPRTQSWYNETAKWPLVHWSNSTNAWGEPVLTVTAPAKNVDNTVFAVIGVNFSLDKLSNFISHLKVGLTGKVFVLSEGEILIPHYKKLVESEGSYNEVLKSAYNRYLKTGERTFLFEENKTRYFAYFTRFPLSFETKWLIGMLIPYNDFIGETIHIEYQTLLLSLLFLVFFGILVFIASQHIARPIVLLSQEVDRIKEFDFGERASFRSNVHEIISLQSSIAALRNALKAYSRYLPKEIMRTLMQQGREVALGGERQELTLLFTDISDFTTFSESLTIDQLMTSLSAYFDVFSKVILQHGGTIDKYIGDSIMAFWGAPQPVKEHAEKACLTALYCLKIYKEQLKENKNLPPWETRIGIHTGEVVVGNIGTAEKMNYTAIGNVVNTAARLQSMNKVYHTKIIISESVQEKIGSRFVTRPLDIVNMKGKKNKLTLYEIVGSKEVSDLMPTEEQKKLCEEFTEAFALFLQGKFLEAKKSFQSLHESYPEDVPTKLYLERLENI